MSNLQPVECERHGVQTGTFVCQHVAQSLVSRKPVGFCWPGDAEEDRPDAWCSACEERLSQAGGDWVGEAAEHLGIQLLCSACYDEARALNQIPSFYQAVSSLSDFLRDNGHGEPIAWAFREDTYSAGENRHRVRWPLSPENEDGARQLFEAGRRRGLVGLEAQFHARGCIVATVSAPRADEIQGWSHGLKLCFRSPFVEAAAVAAWLWPLHRLLPAYRQYQRLNILGGDDFAVTQLRSRASFRA